MKLHLGFSFLILHGFFAPEADLGDCCNTLRVV